MLAKYRPIIVGVCDSIVVVAYILDRNPIELQAAGLVLKLFLLLGTKDTAQSLFARRWLAWGALVVPPVVSLLFAHGSIAMPLVQAVGFALFLATTLLLLRVETMHGYLAGVAWTITAASALFIIMALMGRVELAWQRTLYFHGSQPNLGAELAVAGAVAAALSMRRPYALIIANLWAAWILEGRSAIIAIVLLLAILGVLFMWDSARTKRVAHYFAFPAFIVAVLAALPTIIDAMLLDDRYRGQASGIAGRVGRWSSALDTFHHHIYTGLGYGMHASLKLLAPHNFFLFALAELGLLSIFTFLALSGLLFLSLRNNPRGAVLLLPFAPLLIFNDRFMNLNPYPFVMFVIVFATSVRPQRRARKADPAPPTRRPRFGPAIAAQ